MFIGVLVGNQQQLAEALTYVQKLFQPTVKAWRLTGCTVLKEEVSQSCLLKQTL
jgi:hypothetical protein